MQESTDKKGGNHVEVHHGVPLIVLSALLAYEAAVLRGGHYEQLVRSLYSTDVATHCLATHRAQGCATAIYGRGTSPQPRTC